MAGTATSPDGTRRQEAGRRAYLRRRLGLARAALLWEQAWPACWPVLSVAGVALAVALFDLLPGLPGWLHALILAAFAAALAVALGRAAGALRAPGANAARRRLERASGLAHRPLAVLDDSPAVGADDAVGQALWQTHRARAAAALRRLRVGVPAAGLARRDRWGLRGALALILIVAAVDAGPDAPARLARALAPDFRGLGGAGAALDVWITPPAYTGLAPIVLAAARRPAPPPMAAGERAHPDPGQGASAVPGPATAAATGGEDGAAGGGSGAAGTATVAVPVGSALLAQVSGGGGAPVLGVGGDTIAFTRVAPDAYRARAVIESDGPIAVTQRHGEIAAWDVAVIADAAPTVALARPPSATERGVLRLDYVAGDDYGLTGLAAVIRRPGTAGAAPPAQVETPSGGEPGGGTGGEPGGEPGGETGLAIPLALPRVAPREVESTAYHDLTAHPWAGLEVTLWLEARDAIGQRGRSAPVAVTLPEREFHHPVARAIIKERKRLSRDAGAPGTVTRSVAGSVAGAVARAVARAVPRAVARALSAIARAPQRFGHDAVVFLSLRVAARRLLGDPAGDAIAEVQALLWDTALRVEDGNLSLAERELREIERALREALAEGGGEAEIERLLEELRAAMDRYLDALARRLEQTGAGQEDMEFAAPSARTIGREELRGLIDRARELARTGDREAARELLSQLQNLLENLRVARPPGGEAAQARQAMEGLRALIDRQRELLDETFRRARRKLARGPGRPPPADDADSDARAAGAQETLRRDLGELMLRLGEMLGRIPGPLGRAEGAMREATGALEQGAPRRAVRPQARALDQLQQGAQGAGDALMEQLQERAGQGQGPMAIPGGTGAGRDPLGRPLPGYGGWAAGAVRVPDEMEIKRAREILDELRRRAGEMDRLPRERDYIERLLPRF